MSISSAALWMARKAASITGLRGAGKGHDRSVGGLAGIHVEEGDPIDRLDPAGDLANGLRAPAFAEVGDALDEAGIALK